MEVNRLERVNTGPILRMPGVAEELAEERPRSSRVEENEEGGIVLEVGCFPRQGPRMTAPRC